MRNVYALMLLDMLQVFNSFKSCNAGDFWVCCGLCSFIISRFASLSMFSFFKKSGRIHSLFLQMSWCFFGQTTSSSRDHWCPSEVVTDELDSMAPNPCMGRDVCSYLTTLFRTYLNLHIGVRPLWISLFLNKETKILRFKIAWRKSYPMFWLSF